MPYSEKIGVTIASGNNGLLPDGTKPLPEPVLTYYQQAPLIAIQVQIDYRCQSHQSLKLAPTVTYP